MSVSFSLRLVSDARDRTAGGQVRNREEEDLIKTLYAQVKDLKIKNSKLTKDNEKLTDQYERKKREVSILSKGKKASSGVAPSSARRASPDRPLSGSGTGTQRLRSSALTESKDVDIKAASARRSQDAPVAMPRSGGVGASAAAFRDEGLMQITQQLQARYAQWAASIIET